MNSKKPYLSVVQNTEKQNALSNSEQGTLIEILKTRYGKKDKPSNILKILRKMTNNSVSDHAFQNILMSRLSPNILDRVTLLSAETRANFAEFVKAADQIYHDLSKLKVKHSDSCNVRAGPSSSFGTTKNQTGSPDPRIIELKQTLQHYNNNKTLPPLEVLTHLYSLYTSQSKYNFLTQHDIQEIWLSCLPNEISLKVEQISQTTNEDIYYLADRANEIFFDMAKARKEQFLNQRSQNVYSKLTPTEALEQLRPDFANVNQNEPKSQKSDQTLNVSKPTPDFINSNPEITELKEILQKYNKRGDKFPSNLHNYLRGIIVKKYDWWMSSLPDHHFIDIWLSSLPIIIRTKIQNLPTEIHANWRKYLEAADTIFKQTLPIAIKKQKGNKKPKVKHPTDSFNVRAGPSSSFGTTNSQTDTTIKELKQILQNYNNEKTLSPLEVLDYLYSLCTSNSKYNFLSRDDIKEIWLLSLPNEISLKLEQISKTTNGNICYLAERANEIFFDLEKARNEPVLNQCSENLYSKWTPKEALEPKSEKSDQTVSVSTPTPGFINFNPEIAELKQILQEYNKNGDKSPSNLHDYLRGIIVQKYNWRMSSLPDNHFKDIWLSSLPIEVCTKIQSLPKEIHANWPRLLKRTNKFFTETISTAINKFGDKKTDKAKNTRKSTATMIKPEPERFFKVQRKLNTFEWPLLEALRNYENQKFLALQPKIVQDTPKKPTKKITFHMRNEKARLNQLLEDFCQTGNKKPSETLTFLQKQNYHKINDDNLKLIWLSQLPEEIKSFLSTESESLNALAKTADQVYAKVQSNSNKTNKSNETTADLLWKIKLLMTTVDVLTTQLNSVNLNVEAITKELYHVKSTNRLCCHQKRTCLKRNPHRYDKIIHAQEQFICFYHRYKGLKAKHCYRPCYYNVMVSTARRRNRVRQHRKFKKGQKYQFTVQYKKITEKELIIKTNEDIDQI